MRERAAAIGGMLEIASKPGAGTAIILERTYSDDLVPETGSETPPESLADFPLPSLDAPKEPISEGSFREVRSA
jgi:hypothetical protein